MSDAYIRFMCPVTPQTTDLFFRIIDDKIRKGISRLHLMISSPGGSVFHGLSIHNYLRGAPIDVHTYNFGSVDSIGVIIFCAGKKRLSVAHARFLIHGVNINFSGNHSLDEQGLEEQLKSLKIDYQNISRVIAATTGKDPSEVEATMNSRTTLNPTEAVEYGLVHEIQQDLFPKGATFEAISEFPNQGQQWPNMSMPGAPVPGQMIPIPMPPVQHMSPPQSMAFTRSADLDHSTIPLWMT